MNKQYYRNIHCVPELSTNHNGWVKRVEILVRTVADAGV